MLLFSFMKSTRALCFALLAVLLLGLCMRVLLLERSGQSPSSSSSPTSLTLFQRLTAADSRASEEHKVAVVIPFIGVQMWKILHAWTNTWTKYPACSALGLPHPFSATLFLYFDQDLSAQASDAYNATLLQETLLSSWHSLPHSHCFKGGVQFISNTKGELNHIEGSCVMFYDLFAALEQAGYGHFMWMEPDVLPVQRGWLERMTEEVGDNVRCQRWWLKGSNPVCQSWYGEIRDRRDYHHNGNALYCLGSARFADFRRRVQEVYAGGTVRESMKAGGCATGAPYELGMDHAMFQFRLRADTFDYSKHLMAKFQYTDFVQNHCQEAYEAAEVVGQEPSTYLVHSGASFRHPSHVQVRQVFSSVFERSASEEEVQKYGVRMDLGEIGGEEELIHSICVDLGLQHHIRHERCRLASAKSDRPTSTSQEDGGQGEVQRTKAEQIALQLGPWQGRWPGQRYLWSTDFHSGPSMCNAEVYRQLGVVTHLEIDFGNCMYHGVCKDRLDVLAYDDWHGFSLDPCPHAQRSKFFTRYARDVEMQRVDLVVCSHPAANCELYLPLNKSLVVFATTRLEFGRFDAEVGWRRPIMEKQSSTIASSRWKEWVHNLRLIASSPRNLVAANSLYDKYYIEYFTAIRNVHFLPSLCKPADHQLLQYSPFRSSFLIGPSRDNLEGSPWCSRWGCQAEQHPIYVQLQAALNDTVGRHPSTHTDVLRVERIRAVYPHFALQDVLNHRALIVFPYQSSTMMLTEMYRANVPLLAPTSRFLQEWDEQYNFLYERVYGRPYQVPDVVDEWQQRNGNGTSTQRPDPNSKEQEALHYWINLFDIYSWPHVTFFDSYQELAHQLRTVDFAQIHQQMKEHNKREERRIVDLWRTALDGLQMPPPGQAHVLKPDETINYNIQQMYPGKKIWPVEDSCPS
jgi:hypothetical protein